MDDLDKIDKYEWYGLGGGYWDAGELIDPDDDPNDYYNPAELLKLGILALECVANLNDRGLIVGTSSDDHTQEVDEILEHPLAPWNQP